MSPIVHAFRTGCLLFASVATLGAGSRLHAAPAAASNAAATPLAATPAPAGVGSAFTREDLIAGLTRAMGAHFNFEGELQLDLLRAWTPIAQVAAKWELDVLEYPAIASSSMMVRSRLLGDGKPILETTFVVRAQVWRDVWVTRQPLSLGSAFDPSVLEARRVDVLRERDALPASVGDPSYVFARGVSAGRMLTWRDIARRPLVKKGDLVEVSAVDGPLIVTMKALAMESGAQGDTVTVRNPESRKDFAARVVDLNRVQVRF